jgi:NADH-quinone oxidoreductase subunit E
VTLNNLGIYHFDQIAKWTEREVLWLENHAFAVGRIGREAWQDQARELLAERDATRALR